MAYKTGDNRGWPKHSLGVSWRDTERMRREIENRNKFCGECGSLVHYLPYGIGILVHDNADRAVRIAGIHLPWIEEKNDESTALHER